MLSSLNNVGSVHVLYSSYKLRERSTDFSYWLKVAAGIRFRYESCSTLPIKYHSDIVKCGYCAGFMWYLIDASCSSSLRFSRHLLGIPFTVSINDQTTQWIPLRAWITNTYSSRYFLFDSVSMSRIWFKRVVHWSLQILTEVWTEDVALHYGLIKKLSSPT